MRTCTLHVADMGFVGCAIDLRFDDIVDGGPGDSIIHVVAANEDQAMGGLLDAINGQLPVGPPPSPIATVVDQAGLDSLTIEQFDLATRVEVPVE